MSTENILAVPSNDRLKKVTLDFLADNGIQNGIQYKLSGRQLASEGWVPNRYGDESLPFTLALMKSKDIVKRVGKGGIPLGIVGLDTLLEYSSEDETECPQVLLELGFGKCRLSLAAPVEEGFLTEDEFDPPSLSKTLDQFSGLKIATEYPKLTRGSIYLTSGLKPEQLWFDIVGDFTGSVEVAPSIGQADAVSCVVESGNTLQDNKLKEVLPLFDSQAVLITEPKNKKGDNPFVDLVRDRFFRSLLMVGNPDALERKARIEAEIALIR